MHSQEPSRRDAFRVGLAGAAVAAVGWGTGCGDAKMPVSANGRDLPRDVIESDAYGLSLARLAPHVGSAFRFVHPDGGTADLTLASATDLGVRGRPVIDKGECFALSFAAGAELPAGALEQNTYAVSHPALGSFDLFIVPSAQAGARSYTAVFNRV